MSGWNYAEYNFVTSAYNLGKQCEHHDRELIINDGKVVQMVEREEI